MGEPQGVSGHMGVKRPNKAPLPKSRRPVRNPQNKLKLQERSSYDYSGITGICDIRRCSPARRHP